jgi:hypothetical protein
MKMSELTRILTSNLEEYKEKNVVIAKNFLKGNNGSFTFIPVDFKVFYDGINDTVVLVEEKDSYFFD